MKAWLMFLLTFLGCSGLLLVAFVGMLVILYFTLGYFIRSGYLTGYAHEDSHKKEIN